MNAASCVLIFTLLTVTFSSAIPKTEHGKRAHEKEPLSKQTHFGGDEHEEHNPDYDHEAFLGEEEAHEFDDLSPEESKNRLGLIFEKIDKDQSGFVTEQELMDWIKLVQSRYITEDTDRQWKDHDIEDDDTLKWDNYVSRTYGVIGENDEFSEMMTRDQRRWDKAAENNDGKMSKTHFAHFLHPEEAEHMKDIVIDETIEDIDKDKDGFISLEEYIGDMWPQHDEEEPDWVKTEREQFTNFRDHDRDGKMNRDEIRDWIMPEDYDHVDAEAKHLMYESDVDKDNQLSKEEVLDKYDLFVGSQATDFGEALNRHEEF